MPLKEAQERDVSMILKLRPSMSNEVKAKGIEEYFMLTLGQKMK